ncbi:hypothetical protein [Salinispora tropica]|uniref:Lipoprotein n=1 Tax=Salinispora tropica (strain ATCC BAA-916 / DSM 44818 / JCM 13857 / NBRC 105044 / CNB-440) TaxID=369723 RepID=A4XDE2_SALTO|nr:hypothetical protein [Salinispora tropica]ABP56949.1 hypothetical protein Strop_4521 [Salinispora tropica CNB-440]
MWRGRSKTPAATVAGLVAALLTLGCGTPPELRDAQPSRTARSTSATPTDTSTTAAAPPPTRAPTPTASSTPVAVRCPAGPSSQQVTALVRGQDLLPADAEVRVQTGPLCADDWHYTVLAVTGYEPLQVVSRGSGTTPRLVTAGTDVCTAEVRVTSPTGIRTLACDAGSGT